MNLKIGLIYTWGKIYICDHCKRRSVSASGMASHIRACRSNPDNQHACFKYCVFLSRYVDNDKGTISFECGNIKSPLYGQDLYSYKLERTPKVNAARIAAMTRMPLTCEHYEIAQGHETFNTSGK